MLQNQDNKKLNPNLKTKNKSFFYTTGSIVQKMKLQTQLQKTDHTTRDLQVPKSLRESNRSSFLASTAREVRLTKKYNTPNRVSSSISMKKNDFSGLSKSQRESVTGGRKKSIILRESFLDFKTQEAQRVSLPGNLYSDLTQFENEFQSYLNHNIARKESDFFKENSGQNLSDDHPNDFNDHHYFDHASNSRSKFDIKLSRTLASPTQSSETKLQIRDHTKNFSLSQLIQSLKSLKSARDNSARAFSPKRVPNMVKGVSSSTQETDPDLVSCKGELDMSKKQPKSLKKTTKPALGKHHKLSFGTDPKTGAQTARKSAQSHSLNQVSDILCRK